MLVRWPLIVGESPKLVRIPEFLVRNTLNGGTTLTDIPAFYIRTKK